MVLAANKLVLDWDSQNHLFYQARDVRQGGEHCIAARGSPAHRRPRIASRKLSMMKMNMMGSRKKRMCVTMTSVVDCSRDQLFACKSRRKELREIVSPQTQVAHAMLICSVLIKMSSFVCSLE
jgi:hypothetical protein